MVEKNSRTHLQRRKYENHVLISITTYNFFYGCEPIVCYWTDTEFKAIVYPRDHVPAPTITMNDEEVNAAILQSKMVYT